MRKGERVLTRVFGVLPLVSLVLLNPSVGLAALAATDDSDTIVVKLSAYPHLGKRAADIPWHSLVSNLPRAYEKMQAPDFPADLRAADAELARASLLSNVRARAPPG